MLRQNDEGHWVMSRGISVHDMAHEIIEAVEREDFTLPPLVPPKDLSIARQYVKVTQHGNARQAKMSSVR